MLRRQELLDKIRQEHLLNEDLKRPRTYSPRRRYTPSPPPSRRSLPDLHRSYNHLKILTNRDQDMAQTKHVIEHKFKTASPRVATYQLPAIAAQPLPQITTQVTPQPIVQQVPTVIDNKGSWFNKGDFMEMMMMQNAQMHHMVMQQMMLSNLPGNNKYPAFAAEPYIPAVRAAPTVYHHHASAPAPAMYHYQTLPPLDLAYGREYNGYYIDNGSNYYVYH